MKAPAQNRARQQADLNEAVTVRERCSRVFRAVTVSERYLSSGGLYGDNYCSRREHPARW